ncbi:MAG: alpha/beta fold hydrolase [Porticoccaceae bacterium]
MSDNPELGKNVKVNGYGVNYQEQGTGDTVILIHGSGPGVTGYANWRLLIPVLAKKFHVLAPDVVGFGYTEHPKNFEYNLDNWVAFMIGFMDALNIKKAHFIGNSFGGALSLAIAAKHPDRVDRFVLMGAAGIHFEMTEGLRKVWGYQPSFEAMRDLMNVFTHENFKVSDEIVESRYQASMRPGYQEAYQSLFPEPMQEKLDALHLPEEEIAKIANPALIIHGREDAIVPYRCSVRAHELLKHSELHIYGECGHWTMFEKAASFATLVENFFLQP